MELEAQKRLQLSINDLIKDRLSDTKLNQNIESAFGKFLVETKELLNSKPD